MSVISFFPSESSLGIELTLFGYVTGSNQRLYPLCHVSLRTSVSEFLGIINLMSSATIYTNFFNFAVITAYFFFKAVENFQEQEKTDNWYPLKMAHGTRTVYPGKRNKGSSSTCQPPEEGRNSVIHMATKMRTIVISGTFILRRSCTLFRDPVDIFDSQSLLGWIYLS